MTPPATRATGSRDDCWIAGFPAVRQASAADHRIARRITLRASIGMTACVRGSHGQAARGLVMEYGCNDRFSRLKPPLRLVILLGQISYLVVLERRWFATTAWAASGEW